MQKRASILRTFAMIMGLMLALHGAVLAQQDMTLTKAVFLPTSDVEAFQNATTVVTKELQSARKTPETVFFWTELACDQTCQQQFNADDIVLIHRWVQDYGLNVRTTQMKAFFWQELVDGKLVVRSAQEISGPGAWFVEVKFRALDGQTLCISVPETKERTKKLQQKETDQCKFSLRVR
jgi:hypothetical protein